MTHGWRSLGTLITSRASSLVGVCLLSVVAACTNHPHASTHSVQIPIFAARISADDVHLVLRASGDPCGEVTAASVKESGAEVVVALNFARVKSEADCSSLVGKLFEVPVTLKHPLGHRRLVRSDGSAVRLEISTPGK